jgi:hypothetical protein
MKTLRMDRRLLRWCKLMLGRRLRATTTDVSEFGFCAELGPVFLPGSEVDGELQIGPRVFPFKGTVVWARLGHFNLPSRIGVRFDEIADDFARCLYEPLRNSSAA